MLPPKELFLRISVLVSHSTWKGPPSPQMHRQGVKPGMPFPPWKHVLLQKTSLLIRQYRLWSGSSCEANLAIQLNSTWKFVKPLVVCSKKCWLGSKDIKMCLLRPRRTGQCTARILRFFTFSRGCPLTQLTEHWNTCHRYCRSCISSSHSFTHLSPFFVSSTCLLGPR